MNVHNCSQEDIVVRYLPKPPNKGGRLLIPSVSTAVLHDVYEGMELYAVRVRDEERVYAHLKIGQIPSDVHFNDKSGGFGPGEMPKSIQPQPQHQVVFTREEIPLPAATSGETLTAPLAAAESKEAPSSDPASGKQEQYIEPWGWINVAAQKPEIQKMLLERLAEQQKQSGGHHQQQQQQQQHEQSRVGPPRYTVQPQFAHLSDDSNSSTTATMKNFILPVIILSLLAVAFIYTYQRKKQKSNSNRR